MYYYIFIWLKDFVIDNWPVWVGSILTMVVTATPKYVWRWYCRWRDKRHDRRDGIEWRKSLSSLELSTSGSHLLGKRKLDTGTNGSLRPPVPLSKGRIEVQCSSWAHRGSKADGPNFLLMQARTSLGLSRAKAAEKLDVDDQALGRWERGENLPSREMLPRICTGYGLSAKELGFGKLERFYAKTLHDSQGQRQKVGKQEEKKLKRDSDGPPFERPRKD